MDQLQAELNTNGEFAQKNFMPVWEVGCPRIWGGHRLYDIRKC